MSEWLRRVHKGINDAVFGFFEAWARPAALPAATASDVELDCDKLTPEVCGSTAALMARGGIKRVRVDCLLFDDDGMERLQAVVPLSKIELDFTDLFSVPDLVSDSDDEPQ